MDNPSETDMDALRAELLDKLNQYRENVKNEIITEIKGQIITGIKDDLNKVKEEIATYKKFEEDPDNYFAIGSTKEEVKKIMGVPTSINEYFDTWHYGSSQIKFKNGKVTEYYNGDNNLRIK